MAKRLLFLLLVFAAARPAAALDQQGNYFVRGAGNERCETYLAARSQHRADAFQDWLAGYITGFDRWTSDVWRVERGDFESSLDWLDDYCQAHPDETFDIAAQNLIAYLYPHRVRSLNEATLSPYSGGSTPPP